MSIEAHPNLHAAGLAVDIIQAVRSRLRGRAASDKNAATEAVSEEIAAFCVRVSEILDKKFPETPWRHT